MRPVAMTNASGVEIRLKARTFAACAARSALSLEQAITEAMKQRL